MSNEELATRIKNGETDFYLELWQQVRNFVVQQAIQFSKQSGYEVDDLIQSGFLAMVRAANRYDPDGGASFINFLTFYLRNEFRAANGINRKSRDNRDPIEHAISLNTPLDDSPDPGTLEDLQPDPRDHIEELIDRINLEQLQAAVNQAVNELPELQRKILHSIYWDEMTEERAGAVAGLSRVETTKVKKAALKKLKANKELEQYVEMNTPYYLYVSVYSFLSTHESATERIVFYRDRLRKKLNPVE